MYIVVLRNFFPNKQTIVYSYVGKNGITQNKNEAHLFLLEDAKVVQNLVKCTCHDFHVYSNETIIADSTMWKG